MALLVSDIATAEETNVWINYFSGVGSLAFVGGTIILLWSLMHLTGRLVLHRLERVGAHHRSTLRLPGRIELLLRILVVITYGCQLFLGGWGKLVGVEWQLQRLVLVDELVLLLPFIVAMLMKWWCLYPINRFVREYVVAGQLAEGISARPVWSRRQYISFQFRHGLMIVLGPLLLILAFKDIVDQIVTRWISDCGKCVSETVSIAAQTVTGIGAMVIFVLSPFLLRRIWLTRPLPEGPLRRRLEEFCRQINFGCRNILLWDTYSVLANAAVMGLLRPIRYVLISDNLIENMSDEQIEAVFAHEAGHVKHHHILFLVLFVFGSLSMITLLMELAGQLLNEHLTETDYISNESRRWNTINWR